MWGPLLLKMLGMKGFRECEIAAIRRRIAHDRGYDKARDDAVGWLYPTH